MAKSMYFNLIELHSKRSWNQPVKVVSCSGKQCRHTAL